MKKLLTLLCLMAFFYLNIRAQEKNLDSLITASLSRKDTATAMLYFVPKLQKVDISKLGELEIIDLNNQTFYTLFKYSKDKKQLLAGADFMLKLITFCSAANNRTESSIPTFIDTYANLLYKAGKKKNAIFWEKKALSKASSHELAEFEDNLEKMKKGLPTW